jgi:diadenosine tetraphosphatase ApaH/serine/threonine PP2A family protein phosphatase
MTQLCFFGHTHLPRIFIKENVGQEVRYEIKRISEWEQFPPDDGEITFKLEKGKKYLVNVGSIGQPRDGDIRASFIIYDSKQKLVKRYAVSYDVDLAQKKILESGLPVQLAYRLSRGQ